MIATVHQHPSSYVAATPRLRRESSLAIGELVRQRRYDSGYTQAQVVSMLRIKRSPGWLSRIENGWFIRLPKAEELRDLCRLLGTNRAEVLDMGGFITEREMHEYLEIRKPIRKAR